MKALEKEKSVLIVDVEKNDINEKIAYILEYIQEKCYNFIGNQ